jgi:signal transduction histidine kinase
MDSTSQRTPDLSGSHIPGSGSEVEPRGGLTLGLESKNEGGGPTGTLGFKGPTGESEAIRRLSGETAHVFNNLLTVIRGNASLLLDDSGSGSRTPELQDILDACQRGSAFTHQLLAISMKGWRRPIPLDLADVIRGLDLQRKVPPGVLYCEDFPQDPCRIIADPDQVEQVILTLVSNAADAVEEASVGSRGVIRISLEPMTGTTMNGERRWGWIHLQVADNGRGMEVTESSRAFEPFFTTKPNPPGRGLGLATARGIVRQAGGAVTLESARGWGTRANVWFPFDPDQEEGLRVLE